MAQGLMPPLLVALLLVPPAGTLRGASSGTLRSSGRSSQRRDFGASGSQRVQPSPKDSEPRTSVRLFVLHQNCAISERRNRSVFIEALPDRVRVSPPSVTVCSTLSVPATLDQAKSSCQRPYRQPIPEAIPLMAPGSAKRAKCGEL